MPSIGLKFNLVVQKLKSILNTSKTLFLRWLQLQIKIVCIPFQIVPAVLSLGSRKLSSDQVDSNSSTVEAVSENSNSIKDVPSEMKSEYVKQIKIVFNFIVEKVTDILNIPKILVKAWLRMQIKLVCFPFCTTYTVVRFIWRKISPAKVQPLPEERTSVASSMEPDLEFQRAGSSIQESNAQSEKVNSAAPERSEPRSEDIVKNAKRIRNSVAESIDFISESYYFWDVPLLLAKAERASDAAMALEIEEMEEALKALKDHPVYHRKPKSQEEYDKLYKEARYGPNYATKRIPHFDPNSENMIYRRLRQKKAAAEVKNRSNGTATAPDYSARGICTTRGNSYTAKFYATKRSNSINTTEPKLKKNHFVYMLQGERRAAPVASVPHYSNALGTSSRSVADISNVPKAEKKVKFLVADENTSNTKRETTHIQCQHDKKLLQQNKHLRNQLMITNSKLEQVLKTSNNLLEEVSRLNSQFNKLSSACIEISDLQSEISESRKLIFEIEEERNDLRSKLLALEQMIKEEESYLDDISCESGFDEVENVCDSHEL